MIATIHTPAAVPVPEAEFLRLLGYPRGHQPDGRVHELMQWARAWFAAHGRPWMHGREVVLTVARGSVWLDGREFRSPQLLEHLTASGATRVVLVAVSAGVEAEEEARRLWEAGRPDEYFFLEAYASAVVEQLIAAASGRLCEAAAREDLLAVPHLSPGYTGWEVAEQVALFDHITGGGRHALPGPLEVLSTGMLRPKKSLLAVVGLAPATAGAAVASTTPVPCERCACTPCAYRRAPQRQSLVHLEGAPAPRPAASRAHTLNPRALRKWADERTRLDPQPDGTTVATFRFDGTTCSNMGRPLAFDYRVKISPPERGRVILEAQCQPSAGDAGHQQMCAFIADANGLQTAIESEKPLLGRPLEAVLEWQRMPAPAGCLCDAASRAHKWGLALEVIHFALNRPPAAGARTPSSS